MFVLFYFRCTFGCSFFAYITWPVLAFQFKFNLQIKHSCAINQDALIWDHNFIFTPESNICLFLKCYAIKVVLSFPFLCILVSWELSYLCILFSGNIHKSLLVYLMKVCNALCLTFSVEWTLQKLTWHLISNIVFTYDAESIEAVFFACFRSHHVYHKLLVIGLPVSDFHSSLLETE